jgi:hypothetical protein
MAGTRKADRADRAEEFREQLGERDIEIHDYKVDELRKIASAFGVTGSHGKNKEELVKAINLVRRNNPDR